jgi:DNA primase
MVIERGRPRVACALHIAEEVAARDRRRYITTAGPQNRIGKLFISHLRNGRGTSAIGTYSRRGRGRKRRYRFGADEIWHPSVV